MEEPMNLEAVIAQLQQENESLREALAKWKLQTGQPFEAVVFKLQKMSPMERYFTIATVCIVVICAAILVETAIKVARA